MQRIIVTGATSMIGVALIEECIKHGTEVYAVVREGSKKRSRLPESSLIKFADCSLEHLDRLPEMISQECDTFYHIAWGEYRRKQKFKHRASKPEHRVYFSSSKGSGSSWL